MTTWPAPFLEPSLSLNGEITSSFVNGSQDSIRPADATEDTPALKTGWLRFESSAGYGNRSWRHGMEVVIWGVVIASMLVSVALVLSILRSNKRNRNRRDSRSRLD